MVDLHVLVRRYVAMCGCVWLCSAHLSRPRCILGLRNECRVASEQGNHNNNPRMDQSAFPLLKMEYASELYSNMRRLGRLSLLGNAHSGQYS